MNCGLGRNVVYTLNSIPFRFCACKIDVGQIFAIEERLTTNTLNASGNSNARKACATAERAVINALNAVGDSNARKAFATYERTVTNALNFVADG